MLKQIAIHFHLVRLSFLRSVGQVDFIIIDQIIPDHWLAAIRVVRTPHSHFVAVVNHGRTHVGHLQNGKKFLRC